MVFTVITVYTENMADCHLETNVFLLIVCEYVFYLNVHRSVIHR